MDFQAFTIKYNGKTNALPSEVGLSVSFNPQENPTLRPTIHKANAIWDTGATCTVVTAAFAKKIGLISSGKTQVSGIGHATGLEDTYFVNVYLPNKVCLMNLKIAQVPQIAGDADMLIGMDIIGSGDFSVFNEDGKTVMSYRFPSIGGTDFVKEANNIRSQKAVLQKIEEQQSVRKHLSKKEFKKQKKKNKKRK